MSEQHSAEKETRTADENIAADRSTKAESWWGNRKKKLLARVAGGSLLAALSAGAAMGGIEGAKGTAVAHGADWGLLAVVGAVIGTGLALYFRRKNKRKQSDSEREYNSWFKKRIKETVLKALDDDWPF